MLINADSCKATNSSEILLIAQTIVRTTSFSLYEGGKKFYSNLLNGTGLAKPSFSPAVCFLSGATSGALISFVACPFELTKLRSQIDMLMARAANDHNHKPQGSWAAARSIYQTRGAFGFYSGFRFHLLRDSIGTGMFFTTYASDLLLLPANLR